MTILPRVLPESTLSYASWNCSKGTTESRTGFQPFFWMRPEMRARFFPLGSTRNHLASLTGLPSGLVEFGSTLTVSFPSRLLSSVTHQTETKLPLSFRIDQPFSVSRPVQSKMWSTFSGRLARSSFL